METSHQNPTKNIMMIVPNVYGTSSALAMFSTMGAESFHQLYNSFNTMSQSFEMYCTEHKIKKLANKPKIQGRIDDFVVRSSLTAKPRLPLINRSNTPLVDESGIPFFEGLDDSFFDDLDDPFIDESDSRHIGKSNPPLVRKSGTPPLIGKSYSPLITKSHIIAKSRPPLIGKFDTPLTNNKPHTPLTNMSDISLVDRSRALLIAKSPRRGEMVIVAARRVGITPQRFTTCYQIHVSRPCQVLPCGNLKARAGNIALVYLLFLFNERIFGFSILIHI